MEVLAVGRFSSSKTLSEKHLGCLVVTVCKQDDTSFEESGWLKGGVSSPICQNELESFECGTTAYENSSQIMLAQTVVLSHISLQGGVQDYGKDAP
ncbi:hypothetical protein LTR37_016479 [Vermiconidia calcicola]|uniref:Uncharacterized protein n=1 Tax=Vermiconidia calcicola TaxID=1690605 RepID=A0ACC3MMQ2_9PEZI|nr:hypothetical protein LTR37_016479 [Vermiconidia calcicola]